MFYFCYLVWGHSPDMAVRLTNTPYSSLAYCITLRSHWSTTRGRPTIHVSYVSHRSTLVSYLCTRQTEPWTPPPQAFTTIHFWTLISRQRFTLDSPSFEKIRAKIHSRFTSRRILLGEDSPMVKKCIHGKPMVFSFTWAVIGVRGMGVGVGQAYIPSRNFIQMKCRLFSLPVGLMKVY